MVPAPLRATFRTLSVVAPPVATGIAARLFTQVGPRARVRPADQDVHDAARRGTVEVDGLTVTTYQWGETSPGAPSVLLVHGWQRRASRFGALVRALVEAGWSVESYDGPAHGESDGDRLTVVEHMAAMHAMQTRHGAYTAVVGHSLGAFTAGLALHEGFRAERFASLAGPTSFDSVTATYMRLVGIAPRLLDRLCDDITRREFPGQDGLRDRFDLRRHPVPEHVGTLFVQDADDRMHGAEEAYALHAAHPGSELMITEGQGHNGVLDDETVVKTVVDHLTRVTV
ncbi:alpha/beta fold hydrolase [Isoptericola sediminis]|uniref:Alpha/beta fold hydrolase n=1 Tax=Isoptericola sediminis TaxID=2733572 RepID=A0A849K6M8_9MICO|nr:alpha/beta fold hydrolase [Isoptericola sediminis]